MGNNKKQKLFKKVLNLYRDNINQKDIALRLDISEKTVSEWLKEVKKDDGLKNEKLKILNEKLKHLMNDPTAKTEDIKNITTAIINIKKT